MKKYWNVQKWDWTQTRLQRQLTVLLFFSILISPFTSPVILFVIGVWTLVLYRNNWIQWSWPESFFLGMILISFVSWAFHPSWYYLSPTSLIPRIPTGLIPIVLFGLYYLLSLWVRHQNWDWKEIQKLYLTFWLGGLYVAFIVIVQQIDWHVLTKSWLRFALDFYDEYRWQTVSVRSVGTAGNSNLTAALLICFSLMSIYAQSVYPKRWQKVLSYVVFVIFCIAIWCTGSRGAWAGVVIGLVVQVWMTGHRKWTLSLFFSLVALVLFFPDLIPRSETVWYTIKDRFEIWTTSIEIFRENWLLGTLPLHFGEVFEAKTGFAVYHAHNIFLGVAAEYGIFGIALFMTFILLTIRRARRWRKVAIKKEEKRLAGMLLSQVVGLLSHGMYDYPIISPQVGVVFMIGAIIIHTQYEKRYLRNQEAPKSIVEPTQSEKKSELDYRNVSTVFLSIRNYLKNL